MKKLNSFTVFLFIAIQIFFIACQKNDVAPDSNLKNNQEKKTCLPISVTRNERPDKEFKYHPDGRIDEITFYDTNEVYTGPLKMIYNSSNQITKAQYTNHPAYYTFEYNSANKLVRTTLHANMSGEEQIIFQYRHEYNSHNRLSKLSIISPWFGPEPYGFYTFSYDDKGNPATTEVYIDDEGQFKKYVKITSVYDDRINPYYALNIPPVSDVFIFQSPNNPKQSTLYDANDKPEETQNTTLKYNSSGYLEESSYMGEEQITEKFTYQCK